ncbi:MAG: response regulator [Cytophagaceae bacterium]
MKPRPMLDTILLVDDDEVSNELHMRLIRQMNIARQIICHVNGQDALNYIENQYKTFQPLPSLIFLDLKMPVMDGFAFIKAMKASQLITLNRIPLAVVSVSEEGMQNISALGDYFYMTKPLTEDKILQFFNRRKQKG